MTSEGEKPDALYIVRTGVVSVRAGGEEVMEATAGDVFGENEILNLTRERRRLLCGAAGAVLAPCLGLVPVVYEAAL